MRDTIGQRLVSSGNRPSGFDYLRLILASLVVFVHSFQAFSTPVSPIVAGLTRPFVALILGMFFGLSGFLVAGSLERCRTMISFLGLRLIRLIPALAIDTLIAALVLGPLYTTRSLQTYFSDPTFFSYFLNIIGDVHFYLPGVFESHPWKTVNGQLWTLPYELECYAVLAFLAIIGAVRYRYVFATISCAAIVLCFILAFKAPPQSVPVSVLPGRALVLCFLLGVTCYLFRDKIILSRKLFGASVIVSIIMLYTQRLDYLCVLPIVYIVIFLGLQSPKRLRIVSSGDYSYGIFLYGFAIQQAVFPLSGLNAILNFLLAYPIIVGLAVFSWFCIEKPALNLRPALTALEARLVSWSYAIPMSHWMLQPPVGPWLRRSPAREP